MNQKMEKGGFPGTTREAHPEQPDSRHATSKPQDSKGTPTAACSEDTVSLSRADYTALLMDAAAWRTLNRSPHVVELIEEYFEWLDRAQFRETSNAISAAMDWRAAASAPTYTELQRRRTTYSNPARTPEQIKAQAAYSWRRFQQPDEGRAA